MGVNRLNPVQKAAYFLNKSKVGNYIVKTEFFKKEQSYDKISYLLQQHTKLF